MSLPMQISPSQNRPRKRPRMLKMKNTKWGADESREDTWCQTVNDMKDNRKNEFLDEWVGAGEK